MLICRESLQLFYAKNKRELEKNYPGLSLTIFTEHFLRFTGHNLDDLILEEQYFYDQTTIGIPFAYISKVHFFYENEFYVDSRVLIPRSETEILVEDALDFIKNGKKEDIKVAEIGVGSFALGLSLLTGTSRKIDFWGGDISDDALNVAKINLFKLSHKINKKHNIKLKLSDRLKEAPEKFDLIVSNPPYIKRSQVEGVHHQVLSNEPDIALFLDDSEFDEWFVNLFESAYNKLVEGGAFMMEGHEESLEDLKEVAQKIFNKCIVKNDYTNRKRFLYCYKDK